MSKRQRQSVANTVKQEPGSMDRKLSLLKSNEPQCEWTINYLSSEVMSVIITPDEKFIVAGQLDGSISVIQPGEDNEMKLSAHSAEVKCLVATDDSQFVISGSYDTTLAVWSLVGFRKIGELRGHTSYVYAVVLSNDNKNAISSSNDKTVIIWNIIEMRMESKVEGLNAIGYSLSLSKDNTLLAMGCNDSLIRVWNFKENREQFRMIGHEMPIYSLVISEDASFLISASIDKTLRKWDLRTGKLDRIMIECNESIKCVVLTSDDKYAIYGRYNGRITISPVSGQFEEFSINSHSASVNSLQVTNSSRYIVSGSNDFSVRVNRLSEFPVETILEGHKREINNIDISPDCKLIASASHDHTVLIWSFEDTSPIGKLEGHTGEVYCVAFTQDGRCVSGGVDEVVRVWDTQNFSPIECMKGHEESIRSLAVTPNDKKLVSGSMDKTVRVWDLKTYEELFVLKGHEFMVNCVVVRKNKYAISGSNDQTVRMWDIIRGAEAAVLVGHKAEISSLAVTKNNLKLVCGGRDGRISLWNMKFKHLEVFLTADGTKINKLCLSGDSQFIFTQHDNKLIKIWSLPDKQLIGTLYEHKKILSLLISKDNENIVISTQNKLHVIKSPLTKTIPYTIVPYKYSFLYKAQVHRLLNGNHKTFMEECLDSIFLPWNLNILHVISYMNYPKLLKLAIASGAKFLGSSIGETPLTVSLNRRSKLCAEILLKRIPRELYEKNNSIFEYIGEILGNLNRSSLRSLNSLYDAAFPVVTDQVLPKFGKLLRKPPIIILSDNPSIDPANFLDVVSNTEELVDIEVEFRRSLFKMNLDQGSEEGIKFIKTLKLCKNPEVFRSELVKAILLFKWDQIMPVLILQSVIYVALVIALVVQTVIRDSPGSLIVILILNSVFLFYEVAQLKMRLRSYFYSFWNILDLIRIFFLYAYPILVLVSDSHPYIENSLLSVANAMSWVRFMGYVRIFERTRYMIRMCTEVAKELGPFVLIFITITLGLILSYYSESTSVYTFKELIMNLYSFSYGQFNFASDTDLQKFVFVIATLILTLVMLNLIIALMGDVFQQVKTAIDIADKKEMANIILEIDSIMWLRKVGTKSLRKYLHQCSIAESKHQKNESQRETEEIVKALASIEQRSKVTERKLEEVAGTFNKIEIIGKSSGEEKIHELLLEIKAEIKDTKKEIRLEMMKTKLDIAEVRREVMKVKSANK